MAEWVSLEIEYTRSDGTKFDEMGTHVLFWIDGRWGDWRRRYQMEQNARFIASSSYPEVRLLGYWRPGSVSTHKANLVRPFGKDGILIEPMTPDERRQWIENGNKVHP